MSRSGQKQWWIIKLGCGELWRVTLGQKGARTSWGKYCVEAGLGLVSQRP